MGTRRRPVWQDELSRSFSRLFSRTPSQEREEDFKSTSQESSDSTEPAGEQERGQSHSRLFFRRTSQESNVSGRGTREEPSGLSRLFSRTSSQEKEEDSDSPKTNSAGEDRSRCEDNGNVILESHEQFSSSEPEQVKQDQDTGPALQSMSESEEEKDRESAHNSKELDGEKQPKDKFLNFLGNLFHFSPKSSQGNSKQTPGVHDLSKENEDTQVKNNWDKEDLNQEQALEVCSGTEQAADQKTAYEEDPVVSNSETLKEVINQEQHEEISPKLNGYAHDAPAITYGTYRGSRRIRKLLKRRADVNSPIPEKEETSEKENNCTEDAGTESCRLLYQSVKVDPASNANGENENLQPNAKKISNISEDRQPGDENCSNNLGDPETLCKISSKVSDDLQPGAKENANISKALETSADRGSTFSDALHTDAEESSSVSGDLQPNLEERLRTSGYIQPSAEGSSKTSRKLSHNAEKSSSKLENLQLNVKKNTEMINNIKPKTEEISAYLKPKTIDISCSLEGKQADLEEDSKLSEDLETNAKECVNIPVELQSCTEDNSNNSIDSKTIESLNMSHDPETNVEHLSMEDVQANDDILKIEKYLFISNLQSDTDALLNRVDLQPNTQESTKIAVVLQPYTKEGLKINRAETAKTTGELQVNTQDKLKVSEKPQGKVERIPKMATDQQLNIDVEPNIFVDQNVQVEKPSKRSVDQQPTSTKKHLNSAVSADNPDKAKNNSVTSLPSVTLEKPNPFIHLAPDSISCVSEHSLHMNTDIPVRTVSESEEQGSQVLTDNFDNCVANKNKVNLEKIDGAAGEFNLKPLVTSDHFDNKPRIILINDSHHSVSVVDVKPVPENSLSSISSLDKSHISGTARTFSFDNGTECRLSSPTIISDSLLYSADCNNERCDSPQDAIDSGIVSSQAYTPEEHIPLNTFPSEIFSKHISDTFAVDKEANIIGDIKSSRENIENAVSLAHKPGIIAKLTSSLLLKEDESLADSCSANSGIDVSGGLKSSINSEVYVAKVSVKTVNIEEVKISPRGFLSDVISVGKVESPTYEKEFICLPNLSPPPRDTADGNKFQIPQSAQEDKSVTNRKMSFDREDVTTDNTCNNCEKDAKKCLIGTEELPPSNKENSVSVHMTNMLKKEKKLPTNTDKSPDVLIENLKNNNLSVHTCGDIINVSLQTCPSKNKIRNQTVLSSDSQWEIGSCDSLSKSNPDLEVTHREPGQLNDVLNHSAVQADANLSDDLISPGSTTPKGILPDIDDSESANELFQQKANEIIFTVLHSAVDEFKNINKNSANVTCLHDHISITPDVKLAGEKICNNFQQSSEHFSVHKSKDPFVSTAERIVNDVISSSKQLMASNMAQKIVSEDTSEISPHKTPSSLNQAFTDIEKHPPEDITSSNKSDSLLDINNAGHISSSEINSNTMTTTGVQHNVTSSQATDPYTLNESGSSATVDMRETALNVLTETEDIEEHFNCSRNPCDAEINSPENVQTDSFDMNMRGGLEIEGLKCDVDQNECYGSELGYSSKSLEIEGSLNEFFANHLSEEIYNMYMSGATSELSDPFQFFIHNSQYVEISESDDESGDGDKDSGASGQDPYLSVQSRRVRIYPFALSPIYEDESSCEDAVSSSSSPRHDEGEAASNSGQSHASILSLLQSVSDRLKEADMEETSNEERLPYVNNEAVIVNDQPNKDTLESLSACKTSLDVPTLPEEGKPSGGNRPSLFITKSFTENKPTPVSGRQSFLLNLSSQSDIAGPKAAAEYTSLPAPGSEASTSLTSDSNSNNNTDLSPNTASVSGPSPSQTLTEPTLSIQKSDVEQKPRRTPQSVYYQYFHAAQSSSATPGDKKNQTKLESESKQTEGQQMDAADSDSLKFNPRPGKVTLSDIIDLENKIELKSDVLDATSWEFPNGVNIRVIRGCWVLYEKPHFEGQAHVLEEGEAVLYRLWDHSGTKAKPDKIRIGSVKRVVKDYLPVVVISSPQDTADSPVYICTEVPSLENLVDKRPRSLTVNSGVWLAYTEPQYNGTVTVLEEGCELPQILGCGIKSMRALKMGGLKVQLPSDPKIIIYEKPYFQGGSREITEHVCNIGTLSYNEDNSDAVNIGSMQVLGGIWVGYEKGHYKGQQYLLEEGDYEDWHVWGGYCSTLQSIRYLQANFLEASVTLLDSEAEDGKQVDLFNQAIPDLELAGYNPKMQCIHVKTGMWVAYAQKHYCGEQYILEKGRYKTYMDWGGSKNTIMSIRPVLLEPLGRNAVKHLIKAYKSCNFQGESVDFTQEVCDFPSFMPGSFKVLRGCWLLCYQADSCDNLCVLEEGLFPDLATCGIPTAEIKYIKPIDYVFAEPSVSLFALDSCEGRELHFEEPVTSVLSKDLHFYTQSVWIRRGLWIAFEGANFLGGQMLLDPQKIENWSQFSSWKAIGSLRPLKQPAVFFMIKNRNKDKYLTVTGKLSDTRATFVSISSRNGQSTQIWYFCRGLLKSKANDSCLDVIGGRNVPGSKVSLWSEHGKSRQKWTINKDGTISSYISDDLVLDIKGGNYYDQSYLVVNRYQDSAITQTWDIEIL